MEANQKTTLICNISAFNVFREILSKAPMAALLKLLKCDDGISEKFNLYGEFVASLAEYNNSFSEFLKRLSVRVRTGILFSNRRARKFLPHLRKTASVNCRFYLSLQGSMRKIFSIFRQISIYRSSTIHILTLTKCIRRERAVYPLTATAFLPPQKCSEYQTAKFIR